jgi:putative transposase
MNKKARKVSPNLLARHFVATRPHEKLVTDVSYVYHKQGRLYLSIIKDLYDNSILAYNLSKFNDNQLVLKTFFLILKVNLWNYLYLKMRRN